MAADRFPPLTQTDEEWTPRLYKKARPARLSGCSAPKGSRFKNMHRKLVGADEFAIGHYDLSPIIWDWRFGSGAKGMDPR